MKAQIEHANDSDFRLLTEYCSHISPEVLKGKILAKEVIVARLEGMIAGWLTYTLLYDVVPFINSLVVREEHQREGVGTQLVEFLEREVKKAGFDKTMTSSLANEQGQHFWRKLGYKDIGGVLLADEPLEVFFQKILR